jgi:hypothetical protein
MEVSSWMPEAFENTKKADGEGQAETPRRALLNRYTV